MTVPLLETERLVLRHLVAEDAGELFKTLSDEQVMQYWSSGPHDSVEATTGYLAWNADPEAEHKCWAITTDGAAALGWIILIPHRKGSFELGYILRRSEWRKGYLFEAASIVLDYAFDQLAVRRILADTDPDNIGSIKLLKKLGFQQEGYLRSEWETHIGVRDSLIFGLLRDEWESKQT